MYTCLSLPGFYDPQLKLLQNLPIVSFAFSNSLLQIILHTVIDIILYPSYCH